MAQLPVYQSTQLSSYSRLKHGFFTRQGGVSLGLYSQLNMALSKTDPRENVAANHAIVAKWCGIDPHHVLTAQQEHSTNVLIVSEPYSKLTPPQADALITSVPKIALGVLTADCAPILVYAPDKELIAAIHAGWKGAKEGVISNTIATLETLGARRDHLIAAIGPAIHQDSYEVDHLFHQAFATEFKANQAFFKPSYRKNYYLFDLPGYAAAKLKQEGISHIEHIEVDTYKNEHLFFSYRRTCHRKETAFGNQISVIMLA